MTVAIAVGAAVAATAAGASAGAGGSREGASPFETALEQSGAAPVLERRVLRFHELLGACFAGRGVAYEIPADAATPIPAGLPTGVPDDVVAECATEALVRHGEESAAFVNLIESRAARLQGRPEHRAALKRWSACVQARAGRFFAQPDDLEQAAAAADEQAARAASGAGVAAVDAQGTDLVGRERSRREHAGQVLQRAKETPAATELRSADAHCQRSSGLAEVRAELIAALVRELDGDGLVDPGRTTGGGAP